MCEHRLHSKAIVMSLAACALLCGSVAPALAQLSPEQIEKLRKRGEAEGWTFIVGENEATHRPLRELCGAVEPPAWWIGARSAPPGTRRGLPPTFDWRDYDGCTPIRNQGGCGSCWAFGAIATVESAILINDGLSVNLSEQWLVSCTNAGSCGGGWHTSAYEYLSCAGLTDPCGDNRAVLELDFPYQARDVPCGCPYPHPYWIDGWARLRAPGGTPNPDRIKQAIFDYGPVSTCVHVNAAFQAYNGGVFNDCHNGPVNHVVALVGWDDNQGTNGVWILRNSWGTSWGEDGYMRIEYECSRIGYATCYVEYRYDCNGNGIRDEEEIAQGLGFDCNENCVLDECDIAERTSEDCNGNEVPDECDLESGTSPDCNGTGVPDECELDGLAGFDMLRMLLLLNADSASICDLIPDRFDFAEGEAGCEIVDGGSNMYDGGNHLNTDLAALIPYADKVITPSDTAFGPTSRYFTAKYPGLFVMVASDVSIDWFAIRGDLGADGNGHVDAATLSTVVNDLEYTIFVKRVFGAGTPSVNHIFVVRGNGEGIGHNYAEDTDRDRDKLRDLWDVDDLIYILVARQNGLYLDNADVLNIVNEFASNVILKSRDCNDNGVPDECELETNDLNGNGIPDDCECVGDLDGDLDVDLSDLARLLGNYGTTSGARITEGDLDYDGDVDLTDLSALLAAYGTTCE